MTQHTLRAALRWIPRGRAARVGLIAILAVVAFASAFAFGAWSRACAGSRCPSIEGLGEYDPDQA